MTINNTQPKAAARLPWGELRSSFCICVRSMRLARLISSTLFANVPFPAV